MYEPQYRIWNDESKMKSAIENFLAEKPTKKKWGNFKIKNDKLIYQTKSSTDSRDWINGEWKVIAREGENLTDVIATKLPSGKVLGNASILPLIGRSVCYGNESVNTSVTVIQTLMENNPDIDLIPFNVFEEADLDLVSYKEHDNTGDETVTRNRENPKYKSWDNSNKEPQFLEETVHFTGARLFSVTNDLDNEGKERIKFLFDIDRNEIKHKIFNPFLVQIPENGTPIETVKEAYDSLVPPEAVEAKEKGLHVIRQGEWFFIPTTDNPLSDIDQLTAEQKKEYALAKTIKGMGSHNREHNEICIMLGESEVKRYLEMENIPQTSVNRMVLRAGKNRPNYAETGVNTNGKSYVKGKISHSGREHKEITLYGWHIAVPNTAIDSFTITGDID